MQKFWKHLKGQKGQTATEYMLIVAIVVLGLVAAASVLVPSFKDSVTDLSDNVEIWLGNNPETLGPNDGDGG